MNIEILTNNDNLINITGIVKAIIEAGFGMIKSIRGYHNTNLPSGKVF